MKIRSLTPRAANRFCQDHSVLQDLQLCEQEGFDYIDIQSGAWIGSGRGQVHPGAAGAVVSHPNSRLLSYNALLLQIETDPAGEGRGALRAR